MPLLRHTNQPYFPAQDAPANIACAGSYCWPIALGDVFYQQWYQTPCGNNLACDPGFADFTLGANLVTNGDFATNADDWWAVLTEIGSTTCPANESNWCWSGGVLTHQPGSDIPAYQPTLGLTPGNVYLVTYTVAGMSAGSIQMSLGELNMGSVGTEIYDNGTVAEYIWVGPGNTDDFIGFTPSDDFNGTIDDVSVQLFTIACWTGTGWVFDPATGTACVPGAGIASNLANITTDYIVSGDYYMVEVDMNISAGSLQIYVDDGLGAETNLSTAYTTSGHKQYYFTASQDGVIGFKPDAEFVGCISGVDVRRLKNDYTAEVIAPDGTRYDISYKFQYFEDKVTLNSDIFALLELPYDCYTIEVVDSCLVEGVELTTNGNLADGSTGWTMNNGAGQYAFTGGYVELIFEPMDTPTILTNGDFATGDFTGWTAGANWAVVGNAAVHTPGSTATLSQTVVTETPVTAPNVLVYWIQFTVTGRTAGSVTVTLSDKTSVAFSVNDTITTPLIPTIGGGPVTFAINPSSTFDGTIDDIVVRASHNPWSAFPILFNAANPDFTEGDNFRVEFDITNTVGSALIAADAGLSGSSTPGVWNTGNGTYTQITTDYQPGAQRVVAIGRFFVNNIYYPGRIRLDNFSAVRIEPFDATYTSECLRYDETHEGTKVVTATSDQDAFGFTFDDADFKLQFRALLRSFGPTLPTEANVFNDSRGNARITYAQVEKYWQLHTDFVSETFHDALAIMCRCDHFLIGVTEASSEEYLARVEDYTPLWREEGDYDLATATINIRKKEGGMKFNRHV